MTDAWTLLRSQCRILLEITGADSVTVFLRKPDDVSPAIWLHEGATPPLPELADPEAARAFDDEMRPRCPTSGRPETLPSRARRGRLHAVPAETKPPLAASVDRRARTPRADEDLVWVGLDFEDGARRPRGFPEALELLAALARHARDLTGLLEDPVTDLPSRLVEKVELAKRLQRAKAAGGALALLLVSPDGFDAVNDRVGRAAGDEILAEVARRVRSVVRAEDFVSRHGGATLACLMAVEGREGAGRAASKILERLSSDGYGSGGVVLRFSVGVATSEGPGGTPLEWMLRADAALGESRRGGGAQVCLFGLDSRQELRTTSDRLATIFTGDVAKDYRNMSLLWESVSAVAPGHGHEELALRILHGFHRASRSDRAGLFERSDDGELRLLHVVGDVPNYGPEDLASDGGMELMVSACGSGGAQREASRAGDGSSFRFAVPLAVDGVSFGCLLFQGRSGRSDLLAEDSSILESLGSQMAVALDHARLLERKRLRQEEERGRLQAEVDDLRRAVQGATLVHRSRQLDEVLATARRVAGTDATVLLTGESGSGKEVLARAIHEMGPRRSRPFVIVDCGAISSTLIESELFGHERGAFTGAEQRKPGRLVETEGGTVLLDEIGELPLDVQAKLLRFVQEKQVTPVGSTRSQSVDVRILAATNVELSESVRHGRFRADLYHRLNVVPLKVPPLRERVDDILPLASHFLRACAATHGKKARRLTAETEELLCGYPWPGNVRELQNRILRAVLLSDGTELTVEDFPDLREPARALARRSDQDPVAALRVALARQIDTAAQGGAHAPPVGRWVVDDLVLEAHAAADGVVRKGAAFLGVPETTFRRRLGRAQSQAAAGLLARPEAWVEVREAARRLVGCGAPAGVSLLDLVEGIVLEEVARRCPGEARTGAALVGVTEATLRLRLESPSFGMHAAAGTKRDDS